MKVSLPLKILDQTRISPSPSAGGQPRPPLPLTFFDLFWFNYHPVERLFFYNFPHPTSYFLHVHLPKLKSSLSLALSTFYPLAATVRRQPDGRYEISPDGADSVLLTVSEYVGGDPGDFLDISGDQARPIEKLVPLAPLLPRSSDAQPLFAIQITVFPNHGFCLALTVHHMACDGFSSMQFLKLWAAIASRPEGSFPRLVAPAMDRSVIPDPRNLYGQMEKMVFGEKAEEKIKSGFVSAVHGATFKLSASEIGLLKKKVQERAAEQGMPSFHCSSFVVSYAYSWICLLKTSCVTDPEGVAHFIFAVDQRRRIRPPIPANYFGNCLSGGFVKCEAEVLLGKDGILAACAAIGQGIEDLGDDVHEAMDGLAARVGELTPWRPLTSAGSPKLGVYGIDFGWGIPRKVELISTRETGALALAESRDGDGGIELGIILPEHDLKVFAHHFAAGMDW